MTNEQLARMLYPVLQDAGWTLSLQSIAAVLDAEDELERRTAALSHLQPAEPLSEPVSHESEPHNIIQRYKAERTTLAQAIAEVRRYGEECARRAAEPTGEWRSPITAPQDRDCLFSLRPLAKDDPYFVDTSGNPILGKGEPRVIITRYGRWSSLEVMTGWMPLPQPLNRRGES